MSDVAPEYIKYADFVEDFKQNQPDSIDYMRVENAQLKQRLAFLESENERLKKLLEKANDQ